MLLLEGYIKDRLLRQGSPGHRFLLGLEVRGGEAIGSLLGDPTLSLGLNLQRVFCRCDFLKSRDICFDDFSWDGFWRSGENTDR
jgi:hypothetical protein